VTACPNGCIDSYAIEIYIYNLDSGHATENVGFERREKGRVTVGNYEQPAHEISSSQWV